MNRTTSRVSQYRDHSIPRIAADHLSVETTVSTLVVGNCVVHVHRPILLLRSLSPIHAAAVRVQGLVLNWLCGKSDFCLLMALPSSNRNLLQAKVIPDWPQIRSH